MPTRLRVAPVTAALPETVDLSAYAYTAAMCIRMRALCLLLAGCALACNVAHLVNVIADLSVHHTKCASFVPPSGCAGNRLVKLAFAQVCRRNSVVRDANLSGLAGLLNTVPPKRLAAIEDMIPVTRLSGLGNAPTCLVRGRGAWVAFCVLGALLHVLRLSAGDFFRKGLLIKICPQKHQLHHGITQSESTHSLPHSDRVSECPVALLHCNIVCGDKARTASLPAAFLRAQLPVF